MPERNDNPTILDRFSEGLRLVEESVRALRAQLDQLRQGRQVSGAPAEEPGDGQLKMIVNGKRSVVTEAALKSIKPSQFDLFLDLVGRRLALKRRRRCDVRDLEMTSLTERDIDVLATMIERYDAGVSNLDIQSRDETHIGPEDTRKTIWRLRKELGDPASSPRFIGTSSKRHRAKGEGFTFVIPRRTRACLIRRAR